MVSQPRLYPPRPFSAVVVDRQLASLNSPSHLASDTVFIFPDGEVFLASRAVLAIQCSELTPLLYSREGRHMGKYLLGLLWLGELEIEFQFGGKKTNIQIVFFNLKERGILANR